LTEKGFNHRITYVFAVTSLKRRLRYKLCTLTILFRLIDGYPIVALHSRYAKVGTTEHPPEIIQRRRRIFSPIDDQSRGTWIGFNEDGLLVAVTDQHTEKEREAKISRGILLLDLLDRFQKSRSAAEYLKKPEVKENYRRANLAVLDHEEGWHIIWDQKIVRNRLRPGVYAITSLTMLPWVEMTADIEKAWKYSRTRELRALELAKAIGPSSSEETFEKLKEIARDHGGERGRGSICYHWEEDTDAKGTSEEWFQSSATLVAVAGDINTSKIFYCAGNPCEHEFKDYSYVVGEALR
jgi:hypothetical protein